MMAMEVAYSNKSVFGVRAEEPEDNSEEDRALALATEECERARNDIRKKGCLKVETQKQSLSLIYKDCLSTRKAIKVGAPILKGGESLEDTGHTCTLSESESSHFSIGATRPDQISGPKTVSGERTSEKEMSPRGASSENTEVKAHTGAPSSNLSLGNGINSIDNAPKGRESRTSAEGQTRSLGRSQPVKRLAWGKVEIRNYDLTIGDNPACLAGAPIQLSWTFDEKIIVVPVDEYETYRPPRRKQRQLFLNREVRDKMLHEYGYKRTDISQAVRRANIDRNNRKTTVMNMKFTWFYEICEGASRKMKKSVCGYSEKKEIDKLYQKAEHMQAQKVQSKA